MVLYIHSVVMVISEKDLKILIFSTYPTSIIRITYQSNYMKSSMNLFYR
ncbi:hypothetical protein AF53_00339 [Serratia marcescens BIDMC 80]|nr:hypothetical protein AF53_00339 [Serratia marcescens BIDMC 80]